MTVVVDRARCELLRSLGRVVAKLLLLLLHVVGMLLLDVLLWVMVHGVLRMVPMVSVHHHALVMHRVLLLLLVRVDRSLGDEDLIVVLASRVTTCMRRWGSTVRRRRSWSPVVQVLVFLDVHETTVGSDTDEVAVALSSHLGAHLGDKNVELARDDDVEAV